MYREIIDKILSCLSITDDDTNESVEFKLELYLCIKPMLEGILIKYSSKKDSR